MFKLLRNVRKAYKQWKRLPPDQREEFASDIQRIRQLVRELGGNRALEFVESDAEPKIEAEEQEWTSTARDRAAVIGELKDATAVLLTKMAKPAGRLASDSVPRSVRLGGKVVSAGVRRIGRNRDR
jgi:hypothetical protein